MAHGEVVYVASVFGLCTMIVFVLSAIVLLVPLNREQRRQHLDLMVTFSRPSFKFHEVMAVTVCVACK